MSVNEVFKTFVEPSVERIPVLEVSHSERHQGHNYIITQVIQRNVFTEFDRKLSRHLAATRRTGFPSFTVAVQVTEKGNGGSPRQLAPAHHSSVPHALKGIAERASAHGGKAELTVHHNDPAAGDQGSGVRRTVTADDIEALNAGLQICRFLGEAEFLSISGDFDIIMAGPPGELRPVIMHLTNGSISMPCTNGAAITPFECPIHGFAGHVADNVLAQGYMAQARHALVATKETAVIEFRAMAEDRILAFDRALAGRPLVGHRLDAAVALVERLKAGLGSDLNGLSEDARITALDWSAEIASEACATDMRPGVQVAAGNRITVAHPAAARA